MLEKVWKMVGIRFFEKSCRCFRQPGFCYGNGISHFDTIGSRVGAGREGPLRQRFVSGLDRRSIGEPGLQVPHTLLVTTNKGSLAGLTANSLVAGLLIGGTGAGLAWIFFLFFPSFAPVHGWLLG